MFAIILKKMFEASKTRFFLISCIVLISIMWHIVDFMFDHIAWQPPIYAPDKIINYKNNQMIDYIGIYEYKFNIPGSINIIKSSCSPMFSCNEIVLNDLFDNPQRLYNHFHNLCVILKDEKSRIRCTCPIIINNQLRGYVETGSILNVEYSELMTYTSSIALKISSQWIY